MELPLMFANRLFTGVSVTIEVQVVLDNIVIGGFGISCIRLCQMLQLPGNTLKFLISSRNLMNIFHLYWSISNRSNSLTSLSI